MNIEEGFLNDKYVGTKKQHIVPRLHLRNFANNDGILSVINMKTGKTYEENIDNVCCSEWFYDYNPESYDSLENELRNDEKWMGTLVKKIINEKDDEFTSDDLVRYVCMLNARSLNIMEAIKALSIKDPKRMIRKYYIDRHERLNGKDRSEYRAHTRTVSNQSSDFITSDIPYYCQDVRGNEDGTKDYSDPDYIAWFCPISLKKCIIITNNSEKGIDLERAIEELPDDLLVKTINMNLAYYANEIIMSMKHPYEAYDDAINMIEHPFQDDYRTNIENIKKSNKKNHVKTNLQ